MIMYKNLKHYRHTIHRYLDAIWTLSNKPKSARTAMYRWLATQMGLSTEDTHASKFNREQCRKAIKILRTRYIQLYGKDLPYRNRKEKKSMKIGTSLLQEMVSKAIKGAGMNKMIPITSLLGIEIKSGILTLMTTDGSNHLRISSKLEGDSTDFYTIVNADTFAKLIGKTSKESIELTNEPNYLVVKGNGTYKLDVPVNEDGDIIRFPEPEAVASVYSKEIGCEKLKNIINSAKASAAKTMEIPCLTGYYLADKIVTTDRQMVCYIDDKLLEEPVLISSQTAELLQILDGENVTILKDNTKLAFKTASVEIYARELEGKDIYPVEPIENLAKLGYDSSIKVNKQDLLNILDRMALFVNDYDKNGVFLKFSVSGLEIRSQKSNAVESIATPETNARPEFECLADIEMLKSQVQTITADLVEIHYGQKTSIKLVEGNITLVMSLLDNTEQV